MTAKPGVYQEKTDSCLDQYP